MAGLETEAITPETQMVCTGFFPYGNRNFRCWKEKGHGTLHLHRAIVESCDIYFYQVGLKVGVDAIAHYAGELGLGRKTGIPLPHEKEGIVPSTPWKKKRFGVTWYSGETLSFAVGQGYLNTTPVQLLTLISAVANGGKFYLPRVVERVEDIYGKKWKEYPSDEIDRTEIYEKTLRIIQEALAHGYYVARIKLQDQPGHWSAFWLYNSRVGKIGDEGRDGTEIDIMEKPWRDDRVQHALHWDGYGKEHKSEGQVANVSGVMEGWHIFALLWKADEYVFYVDGKETWRTTAGGVCQVPLYIKLSDEIGDWAGDIKKAELPDKFLVDYVRVYRKR